ncbi:MAG TPA: NADH:ubiquinone reductase (Na(+)-transporting) subunit B, partial [Bacteroidales bacterium]|nr:NADH:ubiquinone reductase (Na(+)-transporting) subunit B [Bacteroidales bacterium]
MSNKIRYFFDKIKPNFEEGGKFYFLHTTYDAIETFFFVPNKVTKSGSHIRDYVDMKRTMSVVIIALFPTALFGIYNIGYQHFLSVGLEKSFWEIMWFGILKFLPLLLVSYASGLFIEAIFSQIRKEEINEGFFVSGFLIPLIVPVDIPLWMLSLATMFAVLFGKEVFGGTGMNIFNPALLARAFLFFAYPSWMSGGKVWISGMVDNTDNIVDGFSGATVLGQLAAEGGEKSIHLLTGTGQNLSVLDMFLGFIPGSIGETSTLAILLGAVILLLTGVGSWRIMLSVFAGGYLMALLLNAFAVNPLMDFPAHLHLIVGGFAFGAVFMATDPVTAAQTNRGM